MYQEMFRNLNQDQKDVVLHRNGPAITLSSAGSGKTSTIITRICHLINEDGMSPYSILAITFTKKAADEMASRLSGVLGDIEAKRVKIGTIHSFSRLIYVKAMEASDPLFETPILASVKIGDFWPRFMQAAVKSEIRLISANMEPYLAFVSSLKRDLIKIDEYCEKNDLLVSGVFTPKVISRSSKRVYSLESSFVIFYNMYERWKNENNYMDFDDMLLYALNTLTSDRTRKYIEPYLSKFEELLVDESQDTSFVSFKIIDELCKITNNVTLVGDTRQLIYGFSGARLSNLHSFIDKYSPKVYDLKTNYRSTKTIVDNSNKLIRNAPGVLGAPAIANNKRTDIPIDFFLSDNESDEAERITLNVERLISGGVQPHDISIIYRVHSQAVALEDSLYSHKIPYYSYSKKAFYLRKEIKDILAYLRIVYMNSSVTKTDVERIINKPSRLLPKTAVSEVFNVKRENRASLLSAIELCDSLDNWVLRNLNKFRSDIMKIMDHAHRANNVGEVIEYILNEGGYLTYLKEQIEVREVEFDPVSNFDALITSAKRFTSGEDFLDHIAKLADTDDKNENGNYVKLMTIHMSKGREWDHVFVAGMCDRFFPIYRAVEECEIHEEKRVAYVAITRPREQLHISSIVRSYGRFRVKPSVFLEDMDVNIDLALREMQLTKEELGKYYNGKEEARNYWE